MASYTNRWSEIEKGLDSAYKAAIEGQEPEDIILGRHVYLKGTLKNYIDFRNKALDGFVKMLGGFSNSMTEESQKEKWEDEVTKQGKAAFKILSDLDDQEESQLNVFLLAVATQESGFFSNIAAMGYGAMQGFMCQNAATLYEERKNLGGKWSSTQGSAKSLNQKSEEAGKEMLEAFEQAVTELGKANRRTAELVKDGVLALKKFQDAKTGKKPELEDLFEEAQKRTQSLVSTAEDVADLYRNAYKNKQTTLILFGNNREALRKFLDKTNLELALKRLEETKKAAETLAGKMITKGQQDDAKAFVDEANKAIKAPVDNYEKGFNDFIKEFKGIFIGPVGSNTLDELLKGKFWAEKENGLKRLNFETELKKYYDDAEDMYSIPLDGLDDQLKAAFKDEFKRELRKYDDEVEKAILTYTRVSKLMFIDYPLFRLKEMLNRSKGWEP